MDQIDQTAIIALLKDRFISHMYRHKNLLWDEIESRIKRNTSILLTLSKMEETGGQPDIVDIIKNEITFVDCSKESPIGRRSRCYDKEALNTRKNNKPIGSIIEMAEDMKLDVLNEEEYIRLQEHEEVDIKTQSWIKTPKGIRDLGGAIFGDRRYDRVFIYHNGADSYYSVRGFRGLLRI